MADALPLMARTCCGALILGEPAADGEAAGQELSLPEAWVAGWLAGTAVLVAALVAALAVVLALAVAVVAGVAVAAWANWGTNSPRSTTTTLTADTRTRLRTSTFITPAHSRTESTVFLVQKSSQSHACQEAGETDFLTVAWDAEF